MALKVLMLKKSIDEKRKALAELDSKFAEFEKREFDLEKAIEEAQSEEEKKTVEEAVEQFESDKKEAEDNKAELEKDVEQLEGELKELEAEQEAPQPEPEEEAKPEEEKRSVNKSMETREFFKMNAQERDMFFQRDDVKAYLNEMRSAIKEKRALTNVGLTIPEVFLGLIRENIMDYSKLYKHVWVRSIGGTGRAVVMGTIPEAVWTDCCANINELSLTFYDLELDCWKVGKVA